MEFTLFWLVIINVNEQTYSAIKNKFGNEILDIEKEISILLLKKKEVIEIKNREIEKIKKTTSVFSEGTTVVAASLQTRIDYEVIKKSDREIRIIHGYIEEQNVAHEKMKEKLKVLEDIYRKNKADVDKKNQKKEEEELIEYSHFTNKRFEN